MAIGSPACQAYSLLDVRAVASGLYGRGTEEALHSCIHYLLCVSHEIAARIFSHLCNASRARDVTATAYELTF